MCRVDRPGTILNYDVTARGKRSLAVDLKKKEGAEVTKEIIMRCILLEDLEILRRF